MTTTTTAKTVCFACMKVPTSGQSLCTDCSRCIICKTVAVSHPDRNTCAACRKAVRAAAPTTLDPAYQHCTKCSVVNGVAVSCEQHTIRWQ